MTSILEIREMIKKIYSKNAVFILPVLKFLMAFIVLITINSRVGFMSRLDNIAIVLIVSLTCSFLPAGGLVFFAALFTVLHMYAISIEVALVGVILYLVLFLMFFRYSLQDSLAVVLTPMLFFLKVPYIVPVVLGLIGTPISAVAVASGVIVYYFLAMIVANAPTINTMGEEVTAKIHLVIDGLIDNKIMLVMAVAFAITVVVVYLLRRMAVEHCWTIAMVAGAMTNLVIILVGDLLYDTNVSVLQAILGSVLAVFVGKIVEFFRFCVDYSRTEKVQFEDDEYYYYVQAIPKITVAEQTKTVKQINAKKRLAETGRINVKGNGTTASAGRVRSEQRPQTSRNISTERTVYRPRNTEGTGDYSTQRRHSSYNNGRRTSVNSGQSVTISSKEMQNDSMDDYEELF